MAESIAPLRPTVLRCGTERTAQQTATIIGHDLKLKAKAHKDLRELDLGLWEGLTLGDLRERFGRVYRQWRADFFSVEPPEGEPAADAATRLFAGVDRLLRKHEGERIGLVLGQFAFAIVRCQRADGSYDRVWDYLDGEVVWHLVEHPKASLPEPKTAHESPESPG